MTKGLSVHSFVRIRGLVERNDLNNQKGNLLEWRDEMGGWKISVVGTKEEVLLSPENVVPWTSDHNMESLVRLNRLNIHTRAEMYKEAFARGDVDRAIAISTDLIDTIQAQQCHKFDAALSDALSARSAFHLRRRSNRDCELDADLAIRVDPQNNGAYFNRAMSLINQRDFPGALRDLTTVLELTNRKDFECLVKRAHVHRMLLTAWPCYEDLEEAHSLDLMGASKVPEFYAVHEFVARELVTAKEFVRAIHCLSKGLSPSKGKHPLLLIWRSYAKCLAGSSDFQLDLESARQEGLDTVSHLQPMIDFLEERKTRPTYRNGRFIRFPATIPRPVGAVTNDVLRAENEKRYSEIDPSQRATMIMETLRSLESFENPEDEHVTEIAQLEPACSRFAEQVFIQSTGLASIVAMLCSAEASFVQKSCALKVLNVVAQSGNDELVKRMCSERLLLLCMKSLVQACSAENVQAWAPPRWNPRFRWATAVPDEYHVPVLAEQSVALLSHISTGMAVENAKEMNNLGLVQVVKAMEEAYEPHWIEGEFSSEGLVEGCINDFFFLFAHNVNRALDEEKGIKPDIGKKLVWDVVRAGQRCSNLSCPKTKTKSNVLGAYRTEGLRKCSRCKIAMYCSVECQHQHWKTHKRHCKKYKY